MQRKLTIAIDEEVYQELRRIAGHGDISRVIEGLVRSSIDADTILEVAYREAAGDIEAEREAREWIEANQDEALD